MSTFLVRLRIIFSQEKGGIIIFDDLVHGSHKGLKDIFDRFYFSVREYSEILEYITNKGYSVVVITKLSKE